MLVPELQRDGERLAGNDGVGRGDQLGVHVLLGCPEARQRLRGGRLGDKGRQQEKEGEQ